VIRDGGEEAIGRAWDWCCCMAQHRIGHTDQARLTLPFRRDARIDSANKQTETTRAEPSRGGRLVRRTVVAPAASCAEAEEVMKKETRDQRSPVRSWRRVSEVRVIKL